MLAMFQVQCLLKCNTVIKTHCRAIKDIIIDAIIIILKLVYAPPLLMSLIRVNRRVIEESIYTINGFYDLCQYMQPWECS